MTQEDYCSFEIAKLLKERGFDEPFFFFYRTDDEVKNIHHACVVKPLSYYQISYYRKCIANEVVNAPTHQMAMKWLRKIHNIFISINLTFSEDPNKYPPLYYVYVFDTKTGKSLIKYDEINLLVDENKQPRCFEEPEQAIEAALKYSLEKLI